MKNAVKMNVDNIELSTLTWLNCSIDTFKLHCKNFSCKPGPILHYLWWMLNYSTIWDNKQITKKMLWSMSTRLKIAGFRTQQWWTSTTLHFSRSPLYFSWSTAGCAFHQALSFLNIFITIPRKKFFFFFFKKF